MAIFKTLFIHMEAWLAGVGVLYLLQLAGVIGAIGVPAG